ncbi:hypothetical protein [Arthrobacter sp. Rue61a]|nr:hypothetical protein [Arthrobacter sp. Rue61a]
MTLEVEAFQTRRRVRSCCIDSPEADLGDVLEKIKKEKFRGLC